MLLQARDCEVVAAGAELEVVEDDEDDAGTLDEETTLDDSGVLLEADEDPAALLDGAELTELLPDTV